MTTPTIFTVDSIESPSTTRSPIPHAILSAPAVAGYLHGNSWPTFRPYALARPDLVRLHRLISITLSAFFPARCLDIERGGATVWQAARWFFDFADHTEGKPIFYTSASNVSLLIQVLAAAGIHRDQYFIWAAHYNFRPHICAPSVCGFPASDGTQYTDRVLGNCDGSIMFVYIFMPSPFPAPNPQPIKVEDMIAATTDKSGHINLFVEKEKTGEVFHAFQQDNGAWDGSAAGKQSGPTWHSLGTPGAVAK